MITRRCVYIWLRHEALMSNCTQNVAAFMFSFYMSLLKTFFTVHIVWLRPGLAIPQTKSLQSVSSKKQKKPSLGLWMTNSSCAYETFSDQGTISCQGSPFLCHTTPAIYFSSCSHSYDRFSEQMEGKWKLIKPLVLLINYILCCNTWGIGSAVKIGTNAVRQMVGILVIFFFCILCLFQTFGQVRNYAIVVKKEPGQMCMCFCIVFLFCCAFALRSNSEY